MGPELWSPNSQGSKRQNWSKKHPEDGVSYQEFRKRPLLHQSISLSPLIPEISLLKTHSHGLKLWVLSKRERVLEESGDTGVFLGEGPGYGVGLGRGRQGDVRRGSERRRGSLANAPVLRKKGKSCIRA